MKADGTLIETVTEAMRGGRMALIPIDYVDELMKDWIEVDCICPECHRIYRGMVDKPYAYNPESLRTEPKGKGTGFFIIDCPDCKLVEAERKQVQGIDPCTIIRSIDKFKEGEDNG